MNALIRNFTLA